MSLGPNDRCWCGSELKYKKCHRLRDEPVKRGAISPERPVPDEITRPPYIANGGNPPTRSEQLVKPPDIIAAMRKAGLAAGEVLDVRRRGDRARCHDRRARRRRARRRTSSAVATRAR